MRSNQLSYPATGSGSVSSGALSRPVVRLVSLGVVLGAVAVVTLLVVPVSKGGLRDAIEPFGIAAPLVFIVAAAVLAMAFVPGPVLSAASGVLFGTWWGLLISVASSTVTSVLALVLARRAAAPAVEELANPRVETITVLLARHGTPAIILQRLLPGVPDAPFSYLFGLLGVRAWQVAVGNVVGSSPRAFSYVALGDAAGTGDGGMVVWALVVMVAVSVVGVVLGAVAVRRTRAERAAARPAEEPVA